MCDFSENNTTCCKKKCYGNFCKKHKRNHLISDSNNLIILRKFTKKSSDYLKDDILNTINYIDKKKYKKSLKKPILFDILFERYNSWIYYSDHIELILKLQNNFKEKYKKKYASLRGEGFIDKTLCNNKEDFFTYETYDEIENKYFFSYKDDLNIVWFFDIRSFKKLIDMDQGNPYTMKKITYLTKLRANRLIEYLKKENISIDFKDEMKEIKKDKKAILKQKMIDLSANIERLGYSFNMEWFSVLNTMSLKKLYSLMEDIWNYRAQLSIDMKMRICPPNGLVFNKSPIEVRNINTRDKMRSLVIDDVSNFNKAVDDNDKKIGYMYFLYGLAKVNPIVYQTHDWIMNID